MRKASHAIAVASLGGTAFIWGGTFGAVKYALNAGMGVEALLAYRFLIGTLGLAVFLVALRIKPQSREVRDGLWLGLLLSTLFWLQTDGLRFTTTTKSGFITGLYVIFTPMAAAFAGDKLKGSHAVGALIALLGLSFLVYQPGVGLAGWNRGDRVETGNGRIGRKHCPGGGGSGRAACDPRPSGGSLDASRSTAPGRPSSALRVRKGAVVVRSALREPPAPKAGFVPSDATGGSASTPCLGGSRHVVPTGPASFLHAPSDIAADADYPGWANAARRARRG